MSGIIIFIALLGGCYFLIKIAIKFVGSDVSSTPLPVSASRPNQQDCEITFDEIQPGADEVMYKIAGLNYRGLRPSDVGYSDSFYILPEKGNEYDKYAVAVFDGSQKHVGYLESVDNKFWYKLLTALKKQTGKPSLKCRGYIGRFNTDQGLKYYGKVILLDAERDDACREMVYGKQCEPK